MLAIKIFVCTALFTLIGCGSAEASLKVPKMSSKTYTELHSGSKITNVSGAPAVTVINSFLKTPAGALTFAVAAASGSPLPPNPPAFSLCRYLKIVVQQSAAAATVSWAATKVAGAVGAEQAVAVGVVATGGASAVAASTQIAVWVLC